MDYPQRSVEDNNIHRELISFLMNKIQGIATNYYIDDTVGLVCEIDQDTYIWSIETIKNVLRPEIWEGMSRLYEYAYFNALKSAKLTLVVDKTISSFYTEFLESDRGINLLTVTNNKLHASVKTSKELAFLWNIQGKA